MLQSYLFVFGHIFKQILRSALYSRAFYGDKSMLSLLLEKVDIDLSTAVDYAKNLQSPMKS